MTDTILEMQHVTKKFSGVKALSDVNFQVERGEIHTLAGENGAGKSTLMKVLTGIHPFGSYEGDIRFDGETVQFSHIKESEEKGIVIIHQELALVPQLSIAENIFLGNEVTTNGLIDWTKMNTEARRLMDMVGLKEEPTTLVGNIGVGKQQLVEIAKAMSKNVKILILDEPTAALNEDDSANLLELMLRFKAQGMTQIIISHKLNEVLYVADSITILRDGQTIETLDNREKQVTEARIIKGMVGRDMSSMYPEYEPVLGDVNFEVKHWTVHDPENPTKNRVEDANFYVRKGEVIGIAGLMGAGRTELVMSIFGHSYGTGITGTVIKDGEELHLKNVKQAIQHGIAYVTEDRKGNGLILPESISKNISLASLNKVAHSDIIDDHLEAKLAEEYREQLHIKSSSILQDTESLSGGNQQKVVLAKWMLTNPDVLILDEPTRGIDVGAKYEIYTIIQQMALQGKSIIVISSELPEVMGISNRIYTMSDGHLTGEFTKEEADRETLMSYMTKVG